MKMIIRSYGRSLLGWLRNGFVLSKSVLFIWGLVLSHSLVENAVVNVLTDYLTENYSLRKSTMLANLLDGVAAVLKVGVKHVSVYASNFNVIIFCTAAYTLGLMLLWKSDLLISSIVFIALGTAVKTPTLRYFFDYQLKQKCAENHSKQTNLWWYTATIIGSIIAVVYLGFKDWPTTFAVSFLTMGAAYLLFMCGMFCYFEENPADSPLTTIYLVFKEAIEKDGRPYPTSRQGYHSKSNNEGSNDSEDPFYRKENDDEVHLKPRDPSFLMFLDKAAIISKNSKNACTAEDVRDVKSLYPMIPLGFTFFAYSLVAASGNTYFVQQTTNLDPYVGNFDVPIMVFFVLKSSVAFGVRTIQSSKHKLVNSIWSIAVGMFCSVLCCIAALSVERRRLDLIKFIEDPDEDNISLSIMVLTPQYFLLGLMEGFAEHGLEDYVKDQVPKSMEGFVDPGIEMLLGIGKFSSILMVLIFHSWIKGTINESRLDMYFIVLASLSFVFFWIYVCHAKFNLSKSEEPAINEGTDTRKIEIEVHGIDEPEESEESAGNNEEQETNEAKVGTKSEAEVHGIDESEEPEESEKSAAEN